jgi:hypothetical protein
LADRQTHRTHNSLLERTLPLGWVHTLGSLPAIPLAVYMIARHGRIVPRSTPGAVYFVSMLIGAATVFLVAHQPVSYGIATLTIVLLLAGYGVGHLPWLGRAARYIETICLSLTVFLLMLQPSPKPCAGFRTAIRWLLT